MSWTDSTLLLSSQFKPSALSTALSAELQVHKFVVGVAPVRSLCRVGWAAKQLLSIPADQLRNTAISNGSSRSRSSDVTLTRQLRRGVTTLARAVTLEALGLGASVAGGADYVLRGGSAGGSEHPAGVHCTLYLGIAWVYLQGVVMCC